MIQNNERSLITQSFAYHWELASLGVHIHKIERRLERLERIKQTLDTHIINKPMEQTTFEKLIEHIYGYRTEILNKKGKIDATKLYLVVSQKEHIKIGHNKAYTIKKALEMKYPKDFL